MTDDEVRAALRRVRVGTPVEWFFRFAPAVALIAAYLGPPHDPFRVWCVAVLGVALVISLALQQVRLWRDRAAAPDERRALLRGLLEKAVKADPVMYPSMAIALVVVAGLISVMLVQSLLQQWPLDPVPQGVALLALSLTLAAGIIYGHRVRLPEHRRMLEALQPPVGSPPPSA